MAYTTIDNPELFFQTVLYTGNGSDDRDITLPGDEDMQPDLVWLKSRDTNNYNHFWTDSVRGVTKYIKSDATSAENTLSGSVKAFNSDGFRVGTEADVNNNTTTYVAWNWKAGGSASSNSDGSITSSVSANTTAGFSIVSYTGTGSVDTFGHGLGAKPNVMIQKKRSGSAAWTVYHDKVDANPSHKYLYLNSTAAVDDYADHFNDTEPTSNVFTLGTDTSVNGSGATNIMYCFTEKKGYSKFGSYTGNGNADGTFVYTGFKPAMIIWKRTDAGNSWSIKDNKRDPINPADERLRPNTSNAADTNEDVDFLSNGFKCRASGDNQNASGSVFIYMAFAESPLVNSNGIPTNAR